MPGSTIETPELGTRAQIQHVLPVWTSGIRFNKKAESFQVGLLLKKRNIVRLFWDSGNSVEKVRVEL
jgi:hypothetical protein